MNKLKLEHESFARNEGKTIGDDLCNKLILLGIKKLPPNRRFKEGIPVSSYSLTYIDMEYFLLFYICTFSTCAYIYVLFIFQIGFYYNTCTDKTWYDTGLRLPQQLCCDPKTGKANPRYKACEVV